MKKAKKVTTKRAKRSSKQLFKNKTFQKAAIIAVGVLALGVFAYIIVTMPGKKSGSQDGVGADGFRVGIQNGANLKVADVVKKPLAETVLQQSVAGQVGNVNVSKVLNTNGTLGQTATYYFKAKGTDVVCNFYTDVWIYNNEAAYKADDVFIGTGDAGTVQDLPARYMKAFTIGSDREYALLVAKDLKVYKFAIIQPVNNIKISEAVAQETLKKIASEADLNAVSK